MNNGEFVTKLLAAKTEEAQAALIALGVIDDLPKLAKEVARLASSLRWFDGEIITALCQEIDADCSIEKSEQIYQMIQDLPFVEEVPNVGYRLHAQTAEGLLPYLAKEEPETVKRANRIAAGQCLEKWDDDYIAQTAIYSLFASNQFELAIEKFNNLSQRFVEAGSWENILNLFNLRANLDELPYLHLSEVTRSERIVRYVAFSKLENYDQAIAELNKLIELYPEESNLFNSRGLMNFRKGKDNQALADYDQAIKLDPENSLAFYNRGESYLNKGDYDRAIADYDRTIELNPEDANAYIKRGTLYSNKGNYDYAITDYDRAIELNSQIIGTYGLRGISYALSGLHIHAIEDYDREIELDSNNPSTYKIRGVSHKILGDYERAIADYDQAIKLNPEDADAFINRGNSYSNKRDYDRAIADYDRAVELNPEDATAYSLRGSVYDDKGDYDRAIADYDRVIELNPEDADAFINRGNSYSNKGDYDRAIADHDQAIELSLGNSAAYMKHLQRKQIMSRQTLRELQTTVDEWINTIGVTYYGELTNTAILMEEVGEVSRLMARIYGEQSFKRPEDEDNALEMLAEEMADVLFVLVCLANQTGIDLEQAMRNNLEKKTIRDRERHRNNPE